MKQKIPVLLIFLSIASCAMAQRTKKLMDDSEISPGKWLLFTGMNTQLGEIRIPTVFFGVDLPVGPYKSIGLQLGTLMRSDLNRFQEIAIRPGSFEIAGCLKFFLHGKLSGHRSGVYLGPDFRVSRRNYVFSATDFNFPPNPNRPTFQTKGATLRALLNSGWQFRHNQVLVETSLPIGIEMNTTNLPFVQGQFFYDQYAGRKLVILPTISIGYVFQ